MTSFATDLKDKAAIVGIGATEFSKESGRSELRLAAECILAALDEAGLDPKDVDGMSTYTADLNAEIEVNRAIGGGDLRFFSRTHYGGGAACAPLLHATMAVATGVATAIVCYRAMNERSAYRFGSGVQDIPPVPTRSCRWGENARAKASMPDGADRRTPLFTSRAVRVRPASMTKSTSFPLSRQ